MNIYLGMDDEKKAKKEFELRTKNNQDNWKASTSIGDTQSANQYHSRQKQNVAEWDEYTGGESTYDEATGVWNYSKPFSEKSAEERYRTRKFKYDINSDPLFKQYLASAKRNGQKAMTDTIAKAAAQTGGVAGSYAVAAGAQNYNDYMQGVNDVIPELESLAYQRYQDELNRDRTIYEMDEQKRWENANTASIAQDYQNTGKPLTAEQKTAWNASGGWIDGDVLVGKNGERYEPGTKHAEERAQSAYDNYYERGWGEISDEDRAELRKRYVYDDVKDMIYNPQKGEYYRWSGSATVDDILTAYMEGQILSGKQIQQLEDSGEGYTYGNGVLYKNGKEVHRKYEVPDKEEDAAVYVLLQKFEEKGEDAFSDNEKAFLKENGYSFKDGKIVKDKTGETYASKYNAGQDAYDKYTKSGWHSLSEDEQEELRKIGYEYDSAKGMIGNGKMYFAWGKREPLENIIDEYVAGKDVSYAEDLFKENGYVYLEGTLYDNEGKMVVKDYEDVWKGAMKVFQSKGYGALNELQKAIIDYYGYYDAEKNWVYRGDKAYASDYKEK